METNERNYGLDYLRIIAMLSVLRAHMRGISIVGLFAFVGAKGVQIFFVLSGYLAIMSYRKDEWRGINNYYVKRAIRILPSYYMGIILAIIINYIITGGGAS